MSTKSICVCTLVGLFVTVVIASYGLNDQILGFMKGEKKGLFEGDICEWDGVNCAKYVVVVSNYSTQQRDEELALLLSNSNNATTTTLNSSSTTTTHDDDDDDDEATSATSSSSFDININVLEKSLVQHDDVQYYQHPPGVVGPSIHDEMIRLTTKLLHFFIAKNVQYKYQPPIHPGPSTMRLTFWLALLHQSLSPDDLHLFSPNEAFLPHVTVLSSAVFEHFQVQTSHDHYEYTV